MLWVFLGFASQDKNLSDFGLFEKGYTSSLMIKLPT